MLNEIFYRFVFLFLHENSIAYNNTYISSELNIISVDLERHILRIDDALKRFSSCNVNGLNVCIRIDNNIIALTDNLFLDTPKANKVELEGGIKVLSLPIIKSVHILGQQIEGYFIDIIREDNKQINRIFYSKNYGF